MKASEALNMAQNEVTRKNSLEFLLAKVREAASNGLAQTEITKFQAENLTPQLQELGYTVVTRMQCGPSGRQGVSFRTNSGCRMAYYINWQNPTV